MSESPPILVRWTDGKFIPANAPMVARCAQHFEAGELYRIEFREDRSAKTHKHFFASINEAFKNLPEAVAALCPTPEDLRKRALIVNGYADHIDLVGSTAEAAQEIARQIRRHGGYCIITSRGEVHRIYIAKSQSMKAMDKKEFQASKQAVLNTVSDWIGVTPAELAANAQHDDEAHHQPNPIPASDRTVKRTDNESPSAEALTGSAGEAPPSGQAGGFTPLAAGLDETDGARPEQKPPDGGEPMPKTYNEYLIYLKAWLSFTKSRERITVRFAKERADLWPTLNPRLTLGQETYFAKLARDAVSDLP